MFLQLVNLSRKLRRRSLSIPIFIKETLGITLESLLMSDNQILCIIARL